MTKTSKKCKLIDPNILPMMYFVTMKIIIETMMQSKITKPTLLMPMQSLKVRRGQNEVVKAHNSFQSIHLTRLIWKSLLQTNRKVLRFQHSRLIKPWEYLEGFFSPRDFKDDWTMGHEKVI